MNVAANGIAAIETPVMSSPAMIWKRLSTWSAILPKNGLVAAMISTCIAKIIPIW